MNVFKGWGRSSSSVLSEYLLGENQKQHRQPMREYAINTVILPWLNEAYSMHEKYHRSGRSERLIHDEHQTAFAVRSAQRDG
jgi:hypothetical protein